MVRMQHAELDRGLHAFVIQGQALVVGRCDQNLALKVVCVERSFVLDVVRGFQGALPSTLAVRKVARELLSRACHVAPLAFWLAKLVDGACENPAAVEVVLNLRNCYERLSSE